MQDAFLKLLEKYENNFEELCDKPGTFFVLVVRNHSIDSLKKAKVDEVYLDESAVFETTGDLETNILREETKQQLVELVRTLKPEIRRVLEYRYALDYTNKEIAEELGISQSLVSTRLERGRKMLKEKIEEGKVTDKDAGLGV